MDDSRPLRNLQNSNEFKYLETICHSPHVGFVPSFSSPNGIESADLLARSMRQLGVASGVYRVYRVYRVFRVYWV